MPSFRIGLLREEITKYYANFRVTRDLLELRNLVEVASLIVDNASTRAESQWPPLRPRLSRYPAQGAADRAPAAAGPRGASIGATRKSRNSDVKRADTALPAAHFAEFTRAITQANVCRAHVLGQLAHRDPIHARLGEVPDRLGMLTRPTPPAARAHG